MSNDKKDKDPSHQYSRGLFFRNYDLYGDESDISPGQSVYSNMGQYKSIEEFRNRKKVRKQAQAARVYIMKKIAKKYE